MSITADNLFEKISETHEGLPGWCPLDKAVMLARLVRTIKPAVVLEIGLFGGKSFFPLAFACKANNKGICIGVDPWSAEIAIREQTTQADKDWWEHNVDLTVIREEFIGRLKEYAVEKFCRIEQKESRLVEPPENISIFHCDGSHAETAIDDIVRFAPKVVKGGFCITDDSNWVGGAVSRGEQKLLELGFERLYPLGTGAVFLKAK